MAQGLERGPIKNSNIMKTTMIIMVPIDQELLEAGLSPMLKYRNIITRVLPEYSPEGYYKIIFRREDIEESPEQMFKDVLVYLIQSINVEFNQNRLNEKAYRMLNKYIHTRTEMGYAQFRLGPGSKSNSTQIHLSHAKAYYIGRLHEGIRF